MNSKTASILLATLLLNNACSDSNTETSREAIKCQGINSCKGTGECSSPDGANDCQGQNECAGQGWISVGSEQECVDQGGTMLT